MCKACILSRAQGDIRNTSSSSNFSQNNNPLLPLTTYPEIYFCRRAAPEDKGKFNFRENFTYRPPNRRHRRTNAEWWHSIHI